MWVVLDVCLLAFTLFHIFITITLLTPYNSPLKEVESKLLYRIVKLVPGYVQSGILVGMLSVTVAAGLRWSEEESMRLRSVMWAFTFAMAAVFMRLTTLLAKLGPEKILSFEKVEEEYDIINFKAPPCKILDVALAPMEFFLKSDATGLENIPTDFPCFYVMNHSLGGVEMAPFLHLVYREKGFLLRGLADHIHFAAPHGALLKQFGAVDGSRENVDTLMKAKQNLLVYPGGGHEVLKHSSVKPYSLLWKQRLGFARMAIKHRYPVLPCCAVGTEDMLQIIADIPAHFARKGQTIPVITTTPSRVQKIYFWFGKPISTEKYNGEADNTEFATELRDQVKAAVEVGIAEMQTKQAADPDRYFLDQMAQKVTDARAAMLDTVGDLLSQTVCERRRD